MFKKAGIFIILFLMFAFVIASFEPAHGWVKIKRQRVIKMKVESSGYCLRQSLTSRGTRVSYGTIAIDPSVIPYHSKIYVPGYGWGRALDSGGFVKNNKIDLWFPSYEQCMQWGRRYVDIIVIVP